MLSEEAKQELKALARSAKLREDFELLRASRKLMEQRMTIDQYVQWLSAMARCFPTPPSPRPFEPYTNVRL